ncbi:TonB-dependent receptor plug domain-containing protein [Hydrogenimonas urashimensis]|uniref:TonB-dependent receptor plug domain-containing protein n=1 Tax=Hydrogenimonas urashimensis TaxID=2740515 RepID=UPI001915C7B6|nr:TonB-dependent receptor [Hydrogenimonas urashimensis]
MKLAKGFKGRYFSLAAIAATVSCVNLQATENRIESQEQHIAQYTEVEPDEETEVLEDIVVESALPSSSRLKNITSDVSVITSEELQQNHYRSVVDALRDQTSLFVIQNGGPGQTSGFTLHGMGAEHVLVLIDGIRVNDPTSTKGQAQLEHLRLSDVEQIEILKGAQSGVWGADAAGGVINIVTKKAKKGLHFSGHLAGGSYMTHEGSLVASYGSDRYSFKAGFDGFKTDGFPPKTTSTFDAQDTERTYLAALTLRPTDSTEISGNYRQVVSDFDYDGGFNNTSVKKHGSADLKFYNLKIDQKVGDVTVTGYGWGSRFERIYDGNAYKGNEYEAGLKGHFSLARGDYTLGVSHRRSKMDKSYGADFDGDVRDNALYGAFSQPMLNGRLVANAALRYDDYDAYNDKTTGKVGLKYSISNEAGFAANVGTGYRVPSLYERYGDGAYTLPNDNLKPESTTAYDARLFGYGATIGYFYNEITDLIDYVPGANYGPGRYENREGKSKIQGVELAYERAVDAIDSVLKLSYTYVDAKDRNDARLLRRPRHRVGASWSFFATDKLDVTIGMQYAADYLDVHYEGFIPKTVQMGEYIVWNAVINYGLPEYGGFYLKLDNIFDEDYQVIDGYRTEGQSLYAGWRFVY